MFETTSAATAIPPQVMQPKMRFDELANIMAIVLVRVRTSGTSAPVGLAKTRRSSVHALTNSVSKTKGS